MKVGGLDGHGYVFVIWIINIGTRKKCFMTRLGRGGKGLGPSLGRNMSFVVKQLQIPSGFGNAWAVAVELSDGG